MTAKQEQHDKGKVGKLPTAQPTVQAAEAHGVLEAVADPTVRDRGALLTVLRPTELLAFQRTIGNRAVQRLIQRQSSHDKEAMVQRQPGHDGVGLIERHPDPDAEGLVQRQPIQRKETQQSVATITNVGLNASEAKGSMGQNGHRMDVWVEIDAGLNPVTPPGAKPNTVYGLEFEYWEYSAVPHDNQGPHGVKPWNDIYRYKPDAPTFDKPAASCNLTWKQAVIQAQAGTLKGKKRIGFADYPGLYVKPGRNVKRDLQFRVVFRDGIQTRDIYATQILDMVGGQLGYSAYHDSLGKHIESHGFGTGAHVTEPNDPVIANQPNRLNAAGVPTLQTVTSAIPAAAKSAIPGFVESLVLDSAEHYVDIEKDVFIHRLDEAQKAGGADSWETTFLSELTSDKPGIVAGEFLMPTIPGTARRQLRVANGGLLIAFVQGGKVVRMYYTDNTFKSVNLRPDDNTSKLNRLKVRSFTEVPSDILNPERQLQQSKAALAFKLATMDSKANAHLRSFTLQGNAYLVDPGKQIGLPIKTGDEILIDDPEIKDASQQWIKAKFGDVRGFIRASKVTYVTGSAAPVLRNHIYWTATLRDFAQIKQGVKTVTKSQRTQIEKQAQKDIKAGRSAFKALKEQYSTDDKLRFNDTFLRVDTAYDAAALSAKGLAALVQRGGGLTLAAGTQLLTDFDLQSGDAEETAKKENRNQALFAAVGADPAIHTAFATEAATIIYIKAHHANFKQLTDLYDGIFGDGKLARLLREHFEQRIRTLRKPATLSQVATLYETVRGELPVDYAYRTSIDPAFKNMLPTGFAQIQNQRWKQTPIGLQLMALGQGDAVGILNLIAVNPPHVHAIEETYDQIFAPVTFGGTIYDQLVSQFKANGNGATYYQQQLNRYPTLDYLLRPAYREVFGDPQLKTMLGQVKTADRLAAVPNPNSTANIQAEQDFLDGGPYVLENFESAGRGKFDAKYEPRAGRLTITLKLAFVFQDNPGETAMTGATGEFAKNKWDKGGKDQYIADMIREVQTIWSGKHVMSLHHPGWTNVPPVQTTVVVKETRLGKEHTRINVLKGTVVNQMGQGRLKSAQASSWVKPEQRLAQLQEWDVKDKISDVAVHTYLHQAETSQNINPAYTLDRQRVGGVLTRMGRIEYGTNRRAMLKKPGDLQRLRDELQRQVNFSLFSTKQKLHILGAAASTEDPALAAQRATHAQGLLAAAGYPIQTGTSPEDFGGVIITVPDDAMIKAEYDTQWRRISAAHEAGHMLGLVDEYNAVSSVEMTRKMISDGLLPPGTPASHVTGEGKAITGANVRDEAEIANLIDQTGLNAPDLTQTSGAKSTSIMTGGFEVMTAHYVTMWEALVKMSETQANVDRKFWQLG